MIHFVSFFCFYSSLQRIISLKIEQTDNTIYLETRWILWCIQKNKKGNKMINVVAGIIKNADNKILIAQRNIHKSQGGLWEFPGGKIEQGETKEEAIVREIKEELKIDIIPIRYVDEKVFKYPDKTINLIAIECRYNGGTIIKTEHEEVKWIKPEEMREYRFAPADEFIVNNLCTSGSYACK